MSLFIADISDHDLVSALFLENLPEEPWSEWNDTNLLNLKTWKM